MGCPVCSSGSIKRRQALSCVTGPPIIKHVGWLLVNVGGGNYRRITLVFLVKHSDVDALFFVAERNQTNHPTTKNLQVFGWPGPRWHRTVIKLLWPVARCVIRKCHLPPSWPVKTWPNYPSPIFLQPFKSPLFFVSNLKTANIQKPLGSWWAPEPKTWKAEVGAWSAEKVVFLQPGWSAQSSPDPFGFMHKTLEKPCGYWPDFFDADHFFGKLSLQAKNKHHASGMPLVRFIDVLNTFKTFWKHFFDNPASALHLEFSCYPRTRALWAHAQLQAPCFLCCLQESGLVDHPPVFRHLERVLAWATVLALRPGLVA